jgi:hypothetical protein
MNTSVEKLADAYKELAPDYEVSSIKFESIVDSSTESRYDVRFKKGDVIMFLQEAIEKLNLPSPEKLSLQI